jgi:hypothetical protein
MHYFLLGGIAMMRSFGLPVAGVTAAALALLIAMTGQYASAQSVAPGAAPQVKQISEAAVQAARAAANSFKDVRAHFMPTPSARVQLPASVRLRNNFENFDLRKVNLLLSKEPVPGLHPGTLRGERPAGTAQFFCTSLPCPNGSPWNPDNMVNSACGSGIPPYIPVSQCTTGTILSANIHPIYFNCPSHTDACWGTNPGDITTFIQNINVNGPLSIVNQYVGASGLTLGRYPLSTQFFFDNATLPKTVPGFTNKVIVDADVQAIVEAIVSGGGGFGTGHMYHMFVPQGTDVCFDTSYSMCYSPDNNSAFVFCGYHGSFTDGASRHIFYSLEPYTFVSGCFLSPQSATDSQVSVLLHETAEWITDPDPGSEWLSFDPNLGEIGDMCAGNIFAIHPNGATYNTQLLYSNMHWACKAGP